MEAIPQGSAVRILFLGRHYTYFRNFESVIATLAERGHDVHAAVEHSDALGGRAMIEALAARFPGRVTFGESPVRSAGDSWGDVASWIRLGLDYQRYQHPLYDDAPRLRERSADRTPDLFVRLSRMPGGRTWLGAAQRAILGRLERAIPDDPAVRAYLEAQRPDLLLITPLIGLGSSQIDYLRAARAMGVPTALCVWSWDHLSSKALIREWPDRVFVWNGTQKREATDLHGVPPSRVVVTGAQCFDQWFERRPSRDRDAFCAAAGLPSDRPMVVYVCSALLQGSPPEAPFVADWIRRVRASGLPRLASAAILVRPHPSRLAEWAGLDLAPLGPVAVWGRNPVDAQARNDYFDTLFHASVVAGLNTSAFIEAGIVGRRVCTVLPPEFYENQMGTLHFRYLRSVGGGLLTVADDFARHLAQLAAAIDDPTPPASEFVREFVRPLGLSTPATGVFVDAVEGMRGLQVDPAARVPAPWPLMLGAIRGARRRGWFERWFLSAREYESVSALRAASTAKHEHNVAHARGREAQQRTRLDDRQRREAEKAARQTAHEAAKRRRVEDRRAEKARARRRLRLSQGWHSVSRRVFGGPRAPEER
jgi:hypothetical protein